MERAPILMHGNDVLVHTLKFLPNKGTLKKWTEHYKLAISTLRGYIIDFIVCSVQLIRNYKRQYIIIFRNFRGYITVFPFFAETYGKK